MSVEKFINETLIQTEMLLRRVITQKEIVMSCIKLSTMRAPHTEPNVPSIFVVCIPCSLSTSKVRND